MKTDPTQTIDLAVVGGGINGAGLAFLAARAGLSVALLDKGDWASGTSSRSTKLIHGGIRYLEQGRLGLVRESLSERRSLLSDAPHLVRPLPFLLPVYRGDSRPPWMLKTGLWLYDLLAGRHNLSRHQWLPPAEALAHAPSLKAEGLLGCGVYWDAQVNDARLVGENVRAAREQGAFCQSRAEVTGVERKDGRFQLEIRGQAGSPGLIRARMAADATGPWANLTSRLWPGTHARKVRPTRGSHLVLPFPLSDMAVLVMSPREKRILFAIPFRGGTLLGTTDVDDNGDPGQVRCTREETRYLLEHAQRLFPSRVSLSSPVAAAFAGLRPLAFADDAHASSVSREDRITMSNGVISILGGKLTTYRSMARKALALVFREMDRSGSPPPHTRLPGAPLESWDDFLKRALREWPAAYGVTEETARHLACLYGGRALSVLEPLKRDEGLRAPLVPGRPEIAAQVLYAAHREDAASLSDVLLRRLEIGLTDRGAQAAEPASRLLASSLGWSEEKRLEEVASYLAQRTAPESIQETSTP